MFKFSDLNIKMKRGDSVPPGATLTLVLASMRAPRSSSNRTMLLFPLLDATWRGVMSFFNRETKHHKQTHKTSFETS